MVKRINVSINELFVDTTRENDIYTKNDILLNTFTTHFLKYKI